MNSVNLVGRITKDLELKQINTGKSYCFFTIAINENYGENKHTNFIPCITWEKQAENLVKFVKKGSQIAVEGSINVKRDNNNEQFVTKTIIKVSRIEFLSSTTNKNENYENNYSNNDLGPKWDDAQNNKGYQIQKEPTKTTKEYEEELFNDDIIW